MLTHHTNERVGTRPANCSFILPSKAPQEAALTIRSKFDHPALCKWHLALAKWWFSGDTISVAAPFAMVPIKCSTSMPPAPDAMMFLVAVSCSLV